MITRKAGSAIAKKGVIQRDAMWPRQERFLWNRKLNKGFATIPKTMPLILQIMDEMSKGKPLSSTYLGLWCATWDDSMVNVVRSAEMAYGAGFSGQRAEYTWQSRMLILEQLKFIDIKAGNSGPMRHVLIWNPHYVIRWHAANKTPGLMEGSFNALLERANDIGAKDMFEDDLPWLSPGVTPGDVVPLPAPIVVVPTLPPPPGTVPPPPPSGTVQLPPFDVAAALSELAKKSV